MSILNDIAHTVYYFRSRNCKVDRIVLTEKEKQELVMEISPMLAYDFSNAREFMVHGVEIVDIAQATWELFNNRVGEVKEDVFLKRRIDLTQEK